VIYRILLWSVFFQILLFSSEGTKRILILHSYNHSNAWTKNVQEGIDSIFEKENYEIHIEYMDTKRHNSSLYYQNLVQVYKNKYHNMKFDIILVSDDNAFNFLKFNRRSIFKNSPIVFCGVNYLKQSATEGLTEITGISEEADVLKNFELIKKLHPKNKNVYIVIDNTTTGNIVKRRVEEVILDMKDDGVSYHILSGYTIEEVDEHLKNKKGVVLLTLFFNDKNDRTYEHYELVRKLEKSVKMPLYALWDMNFGNGVVGGYLTSGYFQGIDIAKIVKRVLDGEDINKIKISYESPNKYMFDYKQMKKHGILVKDLPKDHYLINYKKPFFEEYRNEILFTIGFILLLATVIVLLFINILKRKKVERKLLESEKNLETKVEQRTSELQQTIETLGKTQKQLVHSEKMSALGGLVAGLSHEINTPIGLGLTGITHFLDITKNLQQSYKNDNLSQEEFEKYILDSVVLAEVIYSNLSKSAELIKSFKQISVDQTSEVRRKFNLKNYTEEILVSLTNITKNRKISFYLDCQDSQIDSYPGPYSQIITNLIVNALNHAFEQDEEGDIHIDVKEKNSEIIIIFEDNGKGIEQDNLEKIFDPFFTTNREFGGSGLGLNIIYNIVNTTFKGDITCTSKIGVGTKFTINFNV